MSLNNLLKKYSRIFFLLGLSVFDPTKNRNQLSEPQQHRVSRLIYHMMYIAITLFLIISCWIVNYTLPFTSLSVILAIIYLLGNLMSITTITENYLFPNSLPLIHRHFREINLLFDKSGNERSSPETYQTFEKIYQKRLLSDFIILIVHISSSILFLQKIRFLYVIIPFFLLEILGKLILLHALFYIDMLFYMMKCFNEFIRTFHANDEIEPFSSRRNIFESDAIQMSSQLQLFKLIHHKLWTVAKLITKRFGWTTVIISGKTLFVLTYSVFYIFVRLEEKSPYRMVVRKC